MGIRESLLNTITSVGNSDFVRIVTSAGASSKATVQNLFKSFETGLGAKSSLTTSDYIRVVGSDDVLYKQRLSSVLETMGLSLYYTDTNTASDGSTDEDRFKASFQRILTAFSNSNPTVNRTYPIMIVLTGSTAGTFTGAVNVTPTAMRFLLSYSNINYSGQFVRSSSTVTVLEHIPTRAEVDALKSKADKKTAQTAYSVSARTINAHSGSAVSVPLTIPSGYHLVGNANAYCTGVVGLIAGFDGNAYNANPVPVYINNTTNGNIAISNNLTVRIISLFEKD